MNWQLSFPGFYDAPALSRRRQTLAGRHHLLLAVVPDRNTSIQIEQLMFDLLEKNDLDGEPIDSTRFHITIHSLGMFSEIPSDLISCANHIVAPIAESVSPFEVRFDRALSFRTSQTFVLRSSRRNESLNELHRRLGVLLPRAQKRFTPHITLLYDRKKVAEHAVEPVRWRVENLALVCSHFGRGRHEYLARWPLSEGAQGCT